ncbi:MAG: WYL domain-containing protein, partial [Actinomyces sp.]
DPHRLRMSEGAWYLDAFDLGSQATRTFRLTRIAGKVSVRSDPGAFAPPEDGEPLAREALVAVAPGRALHLRSRATAADPGTDSRPVPVGWDVLKVTYTDRVAFAGSLAALADAAVVMDPPQLRADVVAHLTGVAALGLPTEDR